MKTQLKDRILWWDGTIETIPEQVADLLLLGVPPSKIQTNVKHPDIVEFNSLNFDDNPEEAIVGDKIENDPFDFAWQIPVQYEQLNLSKYILDRAEVKGANYVKRAKEELEEIRSMELEMIFKTLIFVVEELKRNNQVWGVGRGSSCASLVLHLIGIHEVDPVKFNIPKEEFFHD